MEIQKLILQGGEWGKLTARRWGSNSRKHWRRQWTDDRSGGWEIPRHLVGLRGRQWLRWAIGATAPSLKSSSDEQSLSPAVAEFSRHVGQVHCNDSVGWDKISVEGWHHGRAQEKVWGGRTHRGSPNADGAVKPKPATKGAAMDAGAQEMKTTTNHLGFWFLSPSEWYLFCKWSWKKMFEQVEGEKDKKGMFLSLLLLFSFFQLFSKVHLEWKIFLKIPTICWKSRTLIWCGYF